MTDTERPAAAQENTLARIGFEAFAQHFASNFGAGEKPVWENGKNSPAIEELRECIVVAARAIATAATLSPSAEREEIIRELRDQAAEITRQGAGDDHNPFEARKARLEWRAADLIEALSATPSSENGMSAGNCDWPAGKMFSFRDDPDEHAPCYLIMPDGAMIPLAHHAINGVDQARAKFIADACNARLFPSAPASNGMKEALEALCGQVESDLKSAHAEICKLQGLDPETHTWPSWTPQANTLRWIVELKEKYGTALPTVPVGGEE